LNFPGSGFLPEQSTVTTQITKDCKAFWGR
jgi:hypothetical protein